MCFDDVEKPNLEEMRKISEEDGGMDVMIRQVAARFIINSLHNLYDRPTDGPVYEKLMLFQKRIDTAKTVEEIKSVTERLVSFADTAVDEWEMLFKQDLYKYTNGDINEARRVLAVDLPSDYFDDIKEKTK